MSNIRINDRFYSWHDLEFSVSVNGQARQIEFACRAINYDHSVERTNTYGAGRAPLGQSVGSYQLGEVTWEVYKSAWETLKATIGDGYLQAPFAISVRYANEEQGVQQLDIEGSIMGEAESLALGPDAIVVPVRVMPTLVLLNGRIPYADSN